MNCLNNGQFNNQTCKCDCYPNYNGALCENLDCSKPQPSTCASFSQIHCSVNQVSSYCPILCGKCNSNSTTSATPTTQDGASNQATSEPAFTNQVNTGTGVTTESVTAQGASNQATSEPAFTNQVNTGTGVTTESVTAQGETSGATAVVSTVSTCPVLSCTYGTFNPVTCILML